MAESADSYPSVSFPTQKPFPPEFENVSRSRRESSKQKDLEEKKMIDGEDRRFRIYNVQEEKKFPSVNFKSPDLAFSEFGWWDAEFRGIGLLRMEFNGTPFTGTASMFANGSCLLTCAHNVIDYDVITKQFILSTNLWFELRKNKKGSNGSDIVQRYNVIRYEVHPTYFENPSSSGGFDLALCWIDVPKDDNTVKELYSRSNRRHMPRPQVRLDGFTSNPTVAVVGFPGVKGGEKWGMIAEVPSAASFIEEWVVDEEKEIIVYDFIDTSPGQAGSPVMMTKQSGVIGIHVGGSASLKKNWATRITPAKLAWIADCLGNPWRVCQDNMMLGLTSST